jgi:hypothetical protein
MKFLDHMVIHEAIKLFEEWPGHFIFPLAMYEDPQFLDPLPTLVIVCLF